MGAALLVAGPAEFIEDTAEFMHTKRASSPRTRRVLSWYSAKRVSAGHALKRYPFRPLPGDR